jgi:hypothetical protein
VHELFTAMPTTLYFEKFGVALTSLSSTSLKLPVATSPTRPVAVAAAPGRRSSFSVMASTSAFLEVIINSVSARVALNTLLRLVQHCHNCFGAFSWAVVWHSLGLLRDCVLLPKQMVTEVDKDILPTAVRTDFDARVKKTKESQVQSSKSNSGKGDDKKRTKSYLSLTSISEALFGPSADEQAEPAPTSIRSYRWDEGYEDQAGSVFDLADGLTNGALSPSKARLANSAPVSPEPSKQLRSSNVLMPEFVIPALVYHVFIAETNEQQQRSHESIIEETFQCLRTLVYNSGIGRIVSDSRYLTEQSLFNSLLAIICCTESSEESTHTNKFQSCAKLCHSHMVEDDEDTAAVCAALGEKLNRLYDMLPNCSECSCSWLEMLLADIVLRNRDRFSLIWPTLEQHYKCTLGPNATLNFVTER